MKNPFALVTPDMIRTMGRVPTPVRLDGSVVDPLPLPAPPPQTTIVGDLVQKMDRTYRAYTDRADRLTASIADQQEQLRQTRVTIAAIEAAMTTLADDVVLTPDERQVAKAAADAQFDEAVERELLGSRSPTYGDALAYSSLKPEIINSPEFQKWLDEAQRGVRMVRRVSDD